MSLGGCCRGQGDVQALHWVPFEAKTGGLTAKQGGGTDVVNDLCFPGRLCSSSGLDMAAKGRSTAGGQLGATDPSRGGRGSGTDTPHVTVADSSASVAPASSTRKLKFESGDSGSSSFPEPRTAESLPTGADSVATGQVLFSADQGAHLQSTGLGRDRAAIQRQVGVRLRWRCGFDVGWTFGRIATAMSLCLSPIACLGLGEEFRTSWRCDCTSWPQLTAMLGGRLADASGTNT